MTRALALALMACILMLMATCARPVYAEDDCAEHTWAVERVPLIGLVCIGEGWRNQ